MSFNGHFTLQTKGLPKTKSIFSEWTKKQTKLSIHLVMTLEEMLLLEQAS